VNIVRVATIIAVVLLHLHSSPAGAQSIGAGLSALLTEQTPAPGG
jgi:hypothetical protein